MDGTDGTRRYKAHGDHSLDLEYSGGYNDRAFIALSRGGFDRKGLHLSRKQTYDLGKQLIAMSGLDEQPEEVIATGADFAAAKAR